MAEAHTKCPECGNETLSIPSGDTAPDQEVRCTSCGAVIGKRSDFDSNMQKREEKFVKGEVADTVDAALPGSDSSKNKP